MEPKPHRHRALKWIIGIVVVLAVVVGVAYGLGHIHPAQDADPTPTITNYTEGEATGSVTFKVNQGDGAFAIGQRLEKEGIVANADYFVSVAEADDSGKTVQPGEFQLQYKMTSEAVYAILTDSTQASGMLQVKAGDRFEDVIAAAEKDSGIAAADFDAIINDKGAGILPSAANGSFEGWIEPGTYDVKSMGSAKEILTQLVQARVAKLDELAIPANQRERVLIIASIVQGEVNKPEYYGQVARVIDNRLDADMPLQMDSIVAYGNGVKPIEVTPAMTQDASNPYNSYVKKDLPPTPIGNPSDEVIQASMHPASGDWLYFVTVNLDSGETKFTADYDQFLQWQDEYSQWRDEN
jgi:UPF0755 protein